jgi:hypothetical protein
MPTHGWPEPAGKAHSGGRQRSRLWLVADFLQAVQQAVELCVELAQLCVGRCQLMVGLSLQARHNVVEGRAAGCG